jgi:hypothetical protein
MTCTLVRAWLAAAAAWLAGQGLEAPAMKLKTLSAASTAIAVKVPSHVPPAACHGTGSCLLC